MTLIPDVESQIGATDFKLLQSLVYQLNSKRARNLERALYYDMKNTFRDLGISIPPQLRNLEVAMGWPAKAVDVLSERIRHECFVLPGQDVSDWGIPEVWRDNRMDVEAPQAHTSALIHTPAFITTTLGDVQSGEPEILFSIQDANSATGLWDSSRRAVRASLSVLASDDFGATRVIFMTPEHAYGMTRVNSAGKWDIRRVAHGLDRVPVEVLPFKPRLGRPFGSSRISRAVMSITDSAMRTVVRSEVGAEFFSAPQRYMMGADPAMFEDENGETVSAWSMVMGRILAAPHQRDPETDELMPAPTMGQFPQVSMQPHADHLRMWAGQFTGETGVPAESLGIAHDNPTSAEALMASERGLIMTAKSASAGFAPAYVRAMQTAVQMRDNLAVLPDELRALDVRWADPSMPSRAASTDAVMKQVESGVLPADSVVTLEQLGYDETTVARIMADKRRAQGMQTLAGLTAAADAARRDPAVAALSGQRNATLPEGQ